MTNILINMGLCLDTGWRGLGWPKYAILSGEIVALMKPLDSLRGAVGVTAAPFSVYGWGRSETAISLREKKVWKK